MKIIWKRIIAVTMLSVLLVNLTGCKVALYKKKTKVVTMQEEGALTAEDAIGQGLGSAGANRVEEPKKSGNLRLQVFTNESELHSSAWTNVVTAFEEQTGITVTLIMGSQVNTQYAAKWLGGETPADIVWINGNGIPDEEMEASGLFYDLSETLNTATIYGTDMKISDKLNQDVIRVNDGAIYRAPLMNSVQGFWYDENLISEVPQNYTEFLAVSKELGKKDIAGMTYPGMYSEYSTWAFIMPAVAAYGEEFFEQVATGQPEAFLDDRFKDVLTRYKEYCDAGYILKGSTSADHTSSQLNWLNQKAGFITNGMWLEAEMQEYIPEGFEMAYCASPLILEEQTPTVIRNANNVAVAAASPNLENALEFIRFIYRDDVQLEFMSKYSYLSALNDLDYSDAELTDVARRTMDYVTSDQVVTVNNNVTWSSLVNNTFKSIINDIASGSMTVEEACQALYKDAQR